VALQHGINTNIVHRWIREHSLGTLVVQPQAFVPVTLSTGPEPAPTRPVAVASTAEIRMELRRGTSSVTVMWPSELAGDCGVWLREWLR
jgi:transposase